MKMGKLSSKTLTQKSWNRSGRARKRKIQKWWVLVNVFSRFFERSSGILKNPAKIDLIVIFQGKEIKGSHPEKNCSWQAGLCLRVQICLVNYPACRPTDRPNHWLTDSPIDWLVVFWTIRHRIHSSTLNFCDAMRKVIRKRTIAPNLNSDLLELRVP